MAEGWGEYPDPASGKTYFFNVNTGETVWDRPAEILSPEASPPPGYDAVDNAAAAPVQRLAVGLATDPESRRRILEELVLSEASFNADLHVVTDVYITGLRAAGSTVISTNDLKGIFGDWEILMGLSDQLYGDLMAAVSNRTSLAATLTRIAPFLKAFAPYLRSYLAATALKTKLVEESVPFANFLATASSDPRSHGLDLGSFLVMPVQRVPRYVLLLDAILKDTPPEHPEHADVVKALAEVGAVAKQNNDAMEVSKDFEELLKVQLSFDAAAKLNLLDSPNRKLIKSGGLEKHSRRGKQLRQFWLFSDKLIYGSEAMPRSGVFSLNMEVDLRACAVTDSDYGNADDAVSSGSSSDANGNKLASTAFQINTPKKSFVVSASSAEVALAWRTAITDAVNALPASTNASGSTSGFAPKWVPDAAVPACMSCGNKFTMAGRRRHHCRRCGDAVCSACSKNKLLIANIAPKPVRLFLLRFDLSFFLF